MIVLDDLEKVSVQDVYYKGKIIEKTEKVQILKCKDELRNTVHVGEFSADKLELSSEDGIYHVIQMEEGQITTRKQVLKLTQPGELFVPGKEYSKIAVVERHKSTGKIGRAVVKGYGITGGAIASSVSHDSHNIIVIGDNDQDMALAVQELIRVQGGYTIVADHKVWETLPLPIMGLMSDAGYETIEETLRQMKEKAHQMGIPMGFDPFITLSFMALPVIPQIRITPRGIYDVETGEFYKS